jgi:hypothetical protein
MLKCGAIGSYGQSTALRAHVGAENGPKTAETRLDSDQRDPNMKLCLKLKTHPGWNEMPILLI